MVDRWYYAHDGARLGPFSSEQLKTLAAGGKILRTDTVWQEGVEKGALAAKVRSLFVAVASPLATEASGAPLVVSAVAVLRAAQDFAGKPEAAKAPIVKKLPPPMSVRPSRE
jgi:hypothetical protein